MACIRPFRALRYDTSRVSLESVLTQPYDKITPAMQARYYASSPHNLVRVVLGRPEPGDSHPSAVYCRAADYFQRWRSEHVLLQDPEPSIYGYTQRFQNPQTGEWQERTGFVALGRVEPYDVGIVFRHEQTHSGPKADRLELLRHIHAHPEQLFLLYSDPTDDIANALADGEPLANVTDEFGVENRLWRVTDRERIGFVVEQMAPKPLIIADGHHRYETALTYRNEQCASTAESPADFAMMMFVNMDAPGLTILPTHRVLAGVPDHDVPGWFDVRRLNSDSIENWLPELRTGGDKRAGFVVVTPRGAMLWRLREGVADSLLSDLSPWQRKLDVTILHRLVFEKHLGITPEQVRELKFVQYFRDPAEAVAQLRNGAQAAFLLNPVSVEQMRDIAFSGEVMPQKSTDFYPKLLSGLTIYALD